MSRAKCPTVSWVQVRILQESGGFLQGNPLLTTGSILPPTEERIRTSFAPKWSPGLVSNSVDLFSPGWEE